MLYDKRHIYVRSPLRISFVGGGTDLESYYGEGTPGHVVSATIDYYVYVSIKDMFDSNVRVHHAEIETEPITSRIKHNYARIALEEFGMFKGAEVVLTSDVMTTGSGLGASSAIMSSLIRGCSSLRGNEVSQPAELAEYTFRLEHRTGTVGGKQDQYATAFGGLNSITFTNEKTTVTPVKMHPDKLQAFQERSLLIFTNLARNSNHIQSHLQKNSLRENIRGYFHSLQELSQSFLKELESPDTNLDHLGKMLHEAWLLKKSSNHSSTNPYIDQLYERLRGAGVLGGKILGAGGGGFFLAFTKDPAVRRQLKYELYPNFIALDVNFTFRGTEILWKNYD
jgi:D-glycero-alpha-D-manno-heptose-7-phosphate kinase